MTFRRVSLLGLLALSCVALSAQVTQRRGESYDEYNTRRITEETANFKNNNPKFDGPRLSSQADWSAWQGLIDRYNARHAPRQDGPPPPPPPTAAELAAAADEAAADSVAAFRHEMDERTHARFNAFIDEANAGKDSGTFGLAYMLDAGDQVIRDRVSGNPRMKALEYYYSSRRLNTALHRACYFGLMPALQQAKGGATPGFYYDWLRGRTTAYGNGYDNMVTSVEQDATFLLAQDNWASNLLLALWYLYDDIGLGEMYTYMTYAKQMPEKLNQFMTRKINPPTDVAGAEFECLRLLQLVQKEQPAIGTYFIGAMYAKAKFPNSLYLENLQRSARELIPMENDPEGMYARTIQDESRLLLARLHLQRRVPNADPEIALLLCLSLEGYHWQDGLIMAGDIISNGFATSRHSLAEAVNCYERAFADEPMDDKILRPYRARSAIFRGLIKLQGALDAEGRRLPPDLAGARGDFDYADKIFSDPEVQEARCRSLYTLAIGDNATDAAKAGQTIVANTKQEPWALHAGLLYARGQGGLPRDSHRALELFTAVSKVKLEISRLRITDYAEVVRALDELMDARQFEWDALSQHLGVYQFFLRKAAAYDPDFAQPRIDRLEAEVKLRKVLVDAIEKDADFDQGMRQRLAALGEDKFTRPWIEAFALTGEARAAAIEKLPTRRASIMARSLLAHDRIREHRSVADTVVAFQELSNLTAEGSSLAQAVLARDDVRWKGALNTVQSTAARWVKPYFERTKAVAQAKYLALYAKPGNEKHQQSVREAWLAALKLGYLPARDELDRLQPAGAKTTHPLPASAQTGTEWTDLQKVETALFALPDSLWRELVDRQVALICNLLEQSGKPGLVSAYLWAEKERTPDTATTTLANLGLCSARHLAKGNGVAKDIPAAQAALTYALHLGGAMDLDLLREVQGLLDPHRPDFDADDALKRLKQGFTEAFRDETAQVRDKIFAQCLALKEAPHLVPEPWDAVAQRGIRDSVRVLHALLRTGHVPAYRELLRRAEAGEADAQCALTAGLLQASFANAPDAVRWMNKLGLQYIDNLVQHWIDEPAMGPAVAGFLRGDFISRPLVDKLQEIAPPALTTEQPFFVDSREGESSFVRLLHQHAQANPGDAVLLFYGITIERHSHLVEETLAQATGPAALWALERKEQYEAGLSDTYIKSLQLYGDPVSLVLALLHNLPEEGERLELLRTAYVEFARKLCPREPGPDDALTAYCRSVAHHTLRQLAGVRPEAYLTLAAEAARKFPTAQAELGLFLATQSSANAPIYLPLLESAQAAGSLDEIQTIYVANELAQWEVADGPALLTFLRRATPAELVADRPFLTDGRDDYDFSPAYIGDKPLFDDVVVQLLKKQAAGGDAAAIDLLKRI